jgi:hypothetical protein
VAELPSNSDSGADKRRSTRLLHSVPIIVTGTDALGQSFKETTSTVMVSCTGCKYRSTHYVPKNSVLTVEINRNIPPKSRRILRARVVWVQRPSNYRDHFHIAVEFDVPGNVWGITAPPENWFAHPEDIELEIPLSDPTSAASHVNYAPGPYSSSFTASVETIERPDAGRTKAGSQPHMVSATTVVAAAAHPVANGEKAVQSLPIRELLAGSRGADATMHATVKEAIAKEFEILRSQIDAHIREAIAEAMKSSMEQETGVAIGKILEQSNASASALLEHAQKAAQAICEQLDDRIKLATEAVKAFEADPVPTAKPRASRKSSKRKAKSEVAQGQPT